MTFVCCQNRSEIIDISANLGAGKCIYSVMDDTLTRYTHFEKAFVIEVIPPIFREEIKKYSLSSLKELETIKNVYSIPIQQKHTIFLLKGTDQTSILKPYLDGFMACKVEVPTVFEEFTKEKLEEVNYEIKFKLLSSNARLVKKENSFEGSVRTDSTMHFKSGYYTPILEAVAGGYERQMDFVFKLQSKLTEKGYDLSETGIFDEKTKKAISKFQRRNNLDQNILDDNFFEVLDFNKE